MELVQSVISGLPSVDTSVCLEDLEKERGDRVIVVLDDDPTGTQTVHDIHILTEWSQDQLEVAFNEHVFYILTNSRSMTNDKAYQLVYEICSNVREVSRKLNKPYVIITRSDSTLRGHFEPETKAASEASGQLNALIVFVPAFIEGGRLTIDNTHYLIEKGRLIPVSKTPYALDKSFGYSSSHLYEYVIEKSASIQSREEIEDISIDEIRRKNIDGLVEKILESRTKKVLIVNAADQSDLIKVSLGLLWALNQGVKMVIRSGASLVSAIAGISDKPLLHAKDLQIKDRAGLIVVGSYVPKSTRQLEVLLQNQSVTAVELDVSSLLNASNSMLIPELTKKVDESLRNGNDCVIYTSRKLIADKSNSNSSLTLVNKVSQGVIQILNAIHERPSFVLTKGGITSSDVATKALGIKKALVLGQIHAGVPVWKLGSETRYPGMPLIIFPGNVGSDESLSRVYHQLIANR